MEKKVIVLRSCLSKIWSLRTSKVLKLTSLLFFVAVFNVFGQQNVVTGIVRDSNGDPIPGANVVVVGTTVGATTDMDGRYSLAIPAGGTTLSISFIGMEPQEVVIGSQSQINVTLTSSAIGLGEVVVTALGIARETKTLTYAAQQVSGDEMLKAQDINFMSAISGRAAGIQVNQTTSGAGGSTRTLLRGVKSFNSGSAPLYVIDGVPMVNRTSGNVGLWGGTDQGDGLSALNPDDIESISILKGANASVLYGSQGANGVILITTKKGQQGTTDISVNSAATFETVSIWPELQFEYADWSDTRITNPAITMQDIKDFFQVGYNIANNIALSGSVGATSVYFSYGNTTSRGIQPTNTYERQNVSLRQSTKFFNNKLTLSSNVMLSTEERYNPARAGYTFNPLFSLYLYPRGGDKLGRDIHYYEENYWEMNEERNIQKMNWDQVAIDHWQNNPWWLLYKHQNTNTAKRVIASTTAAWDIATGLKLTLKANYDYANRVRDNRMFSGGNLVGVGKNGTWSYSEFVDWQAYFDGVLQYNTRFGDFSLDALVGGSTQESLFGRGSSVNVSSDEALYFPNEFNYQNVMQNNVINQTVASRTIKHGLFANASIGFKDMIFLDLSGRNDWSSTLAFTDGGVSYFYPAVGISALISQMVSLPSFITFGKVRGSYTVVANDLSFNRIVPIGTITGRTATAASVSNPSVPPFYEAKPEMITSYEFGTDWRFLQGRIGLDFTFYNTLSRDQFFTMPTLQGTGYANKYANVGELRNRGVEIVVDAEPVATGDFKWHTSLNFARNVNKVLVLNPNNPDYILNAGGGGYRDGYASYVIQGGSFGDVYTYSYLYDEQGRIKLDNQYRPQRSTELERQGKSTPEFTLGWNHTLNYKRWSMGFLINGVFGGIVVSKVEAMFDGWENGTSKRSAEARKNGGYSVNAIVDHPRIVIINDSGVEEVVQFEADNHGEIVSKVNAQTWFQSAGSSLPVLSDPNYMYKRTNVRFSQFSLNYNIPVRQLNLPLKSASLGFVGQNLFFLYRDAPYDPERAMSAGDDTQALDNFTLPATRTWGFNLRFNF